MEVALLYRFNRHQLWEINSCRVYLQVITISDIMDAAGIRILPSAFLGHRDPSRSSSLHWPAWQRPSGWSSWHSLLQHISTRGRLLQELGQWLAPSHQKWQWFHDTSQDVVYRQITPDRWERFNPLRGRRVTRRSQTLYATPIQCQAPDSLSLLYPTTVVSHTDGSIRSIPGYYPFAEQSVTAQSLWNPAHIPPELSNTPSFYQRLIGSNPPTALQCSEIADALRNGVELLGCSDGSYVEDGSHCYHGWLFASDLQTTLAEGSGPGTGTLRIYCDNKSALDKTVTTAPKGITPFLMSDYDLIDLIRLFHALLPITVVGEWVKGHYSGDKREYKHDLNDRADHLATSTHRHPSRSFATTANVLPPPGYRVRLLKDNGLITSKYYQTLAQAHHEQPIIDHILRKTGWTVTIFQSVDWDSHHCAFRCLSRFQRISVSKIIHGLCNTNHQNHLLCNASNLCPGCESAEETFEHVLCCPCPQVCIALHPWLLCGRAL